MTRLSRTRPFSSSSAALLPLLLLVALLAPPPCESARNGKSTLAAFETSRTRNGNSAASSSLIADSAVPAAHIADPTLAAPTSATPFLAPPRRSLIFNRLFTRLIGRRYCRSSSLSGYTSSRVLGNGLVLHWVATTGSQLSVAVEAKGGSKAAGGWFAVGWSPDGTMGGAIAIAKEDNVLPMAYNLQAGSAVEASDWSVLDSSISQATDGGFVMRFSRTTNDGAAVPLVTTRLVDIIFAHGWSSTVQYHSFS